MIPINDIRAWSNVVPWVNDEQIEQDLVISRSLIEIFSDDYLASKLAFRGGTAIHKLFLQPQPRYSEDIDLVQKESGPIKEIITRILQSVSSMHKNSCGPFLNVDRHLKHFLIVQLTEVRSTFFGLLSRLDPWSPYEIKLQLPFSSSFNKLNLSIC